MHPQRQGICITESSGLWTLYCLSRNNYVYTALNILYVCPSRIFLYSLFAKSILCFVYGLSALVYFMLCQQCLGLFL